MKNLILIASLIMSTSVFSQAKYEQSKASPITNTSIPTKWSLSVTSGYINIPTPNLGNNVWASSNISYSIKKWSITGWVGTNYWIEGRQPDLRLGVSTTYTILKW